MYLNITEGFFLFLNGVNGNFLEHQPDNSINSSLCPCSLPSALQGHGPLGISYLTSLDNIAVCRHFSAFRPEHCPVNIQY